MKNLNKAIIKVMDQIGVKGKENRKFMSDFVKMCVMERIKPLK